MFSLSNLFNIEEKAKPTLSKDRIAQLLKTTPEALAAFEEAYTKQILENTKPTDNLFAINSRMASNMNHDRSLNVTCTEKVTDLIDRIVNELAAQTEILSYNGDEITFSARKALPEKTVTQTELNEVPQNIRPELTGTLMKRDIEEPASHAVLWYLDQMMKETNPRKAESCYHQFRQGLDILDLDPLLYEMLGCNKNSMSYWLPSLIQANDARKFFKIPKTKIAKVPMSLLQLTRSEYTELTPTTLRIVDKWAEQIFDLKESDDYFIKTGTYSSKFDFRNCRVRNAKEVHELGEYLLFIHYQALQMASPLVQPCIYGVSTTNEWVVREYIPDKENNPCIYKGLPLHTEYRVFVDCDTKEVLGISPYWEPETMKKRFNREDSADNPHDFHDYAVYKAHEETLMNRYNINKELIETKVQEMLPDLSLHGQWSIDIMQNGNDFWLIDMALAENSAFYKDVVAIEDRRPTKESWIPQITEK